MVSHRSAPDGCAVGRAAVEPIAPAVALRMAETFRVLADPTRLRILSVLARGELCVHQVAKAVGMSQPAVSHHLRVLRYMRLVSHERRGRHVYYRLEDEHVSTLLAQAHRHASHAGAASESAQDAAQEASGPYPAVEARAS